MEALKQRQKRYLEQLKKAHSERRVKVITGLSGIGKTRLLNDYAGLLLRSGVEEKDCIRLSLRDPENEYLRSPEQLRYLFQDYMETPGKRYYVLVDDLDLAIHPRRQDQAIPKLLRELQEQNVDVTAVCSDRRVLTQGDSSFLERSVEIRMEPLSFQEFMLDWNGTVEEGLREFSLHGGIPAALVRPSSEEKEAVLKQVLRKAINSVARLSRIAPGDERLMEMLELVAETAGDLISPAWLTRELDDAGRKIVPATVERYLHFFQECGVLRKVEMRDVRRRNLRKTPCKYYFIDPGLQNCCLGFPRVMTNTILEPVVCQQLNAWGYKTEIGLIVHNHFDHRGVKIRRQLEIDFAVEEKKGDHLLCIQMEPVDPADMRKALEPMERALGIYVGQRVQRVKCILLLRNRSLFQQADGIQRVSLPSFLAGSGPEPD